MSPAPDDQPDIPAHVDSSIAAIGRIAENHRSATTAPQRALARVTYEIGRPVSILALTILLAVWLAVNAVLPALHPGTRGFDPPPFGILSAVTSVGALYVTLVILGSQRHESKLADSRSELTLQLALISEQKIAKAVELLEALRRDDPHITDRVDPEAEAMAEPSDAAALLELRE